LLVGRSFLVVLGEKQNTTNVRDFYFGGGGGVPPSKIHFQGAGIGILKKNMVAKGLPGLRQQKMFDLIMKFV